MDGSLLLDTIERCYFGFRRRRRDVRQATSCECNACVRIPDLNLKFVVHHGQALDQRMAGRDEIMGSDLIVAHRLLKNDVVQETAATAYALITQACIDALVVDPVVLGSPVWFAQRARGRLKGKVPAVRASGTQRRK